MKKSLTSFISILQKNNEQFRSGYITLKNIRGGNVADNGGVCSNGDCTGTNKVDCSNTGDCTHASNTLKCSNTGGTGCCGSA